MSVDFANLATLGKYPNTFMKRGARAEEFLYGVLVIPARATAALRSLDAARNIVDAV